MAVPVVNAIINFSTGPSFAQTMILDTGILDTNILGDAAAVIVDVSDQVISITTERGRNALADQFQAGQMTLKISDQNGDFNPLNTSSPYSPYLTPMKKVQITATFNGVTYPLFSGFITSYVNTVSKNSNVAYTTITAVDGFKLLNNAQISTVIGAAAGNLSGTRINQILDQISWPASMRDVDAGLTTLQADPGTFRTSLAALQTVSDSEYGAFYMDALGNAVFQDRSVTAGSIGGTATNFADNGTGISYFNSVWVLNDVLIYNTANITMLGGTTQTASNADSIAKYFLKSYVLGKIFFFVNFVSAFI